MFHQSFRESWTGGRKKRERSCIAMLNLINRCYKILRRKSTILLKQQNRKPRKLSKNFDLVKMDWKLSNSCRFQSMQKWNRRNSADSNWKPKNKPVVESVLDSSCKRFCDTAIRKNFNLKPEIQIKKLILRIEAAISVNTLK